MSWIADARRRQIRHKGRTMTLSQGGSRGLTVDLIAYSAPPATAALEAGVSVMPFVAEITNDELAAVQFGRPKNGDRLMDGGRTYTLTDETAVYDGSTICGWKLFAAGGT
ncbi:hypothetical protein [Gluconobacter cerinus]|uniref:hypothetical protein n=1 Tax=Gluconobacter cerinus TaxID=38307 RepID=UPI001B8C5018|nr:hypothetical protein [Gluconobacter cerinus]MBS1035389.1 hypothetical protein [Gluconobacter cerinus]